MNYTINKSGKLVMINVLANADPSMIGMQIGDSQIISMDVDELDTIILNAYGEFMRYHYVHTLMKYHVLEPNTDGTKKPLIVMETVEKDNFPTNYKEILNLLKLYKAIDIFSCYTAFYKFKNGRLTHGGAGEIIQPEHPMYWPQKSYVISQEDQEQFGQWYKTYKDIFNVNNNDKFKQIVKMYIDSFMMDSAEISFVILSVILEMLFGASGSELTYRISRGAALFLSSNRDEMKDIHSRVKKLYNLRSKYVHEGREIEWERLFELREIVRRIIVRMYECKMNKNFFNFKKFAEELSFDGYVKEAVSIARSNT